MAPLRTAPPARAASVPHGRTARRLEWVLLPPALRSLIEFRLGSRVVAAESAGPGYTPGFASTLTCADGSRHFVKAANRKAQRPFAEAYRRETAVLSALPPRLPVPRLLWSHHDDLWVAMELEYVDGPPPTRPWASEQLDDCLDTLEVIARAQPPATLRLTTFAEDFADCGAGWDHVRRVDPDLPHLDEAAALVARIPEATAGVALVNTDARDDNFLVTAAGAVLCDWSGPCLGADWLDTVSVLVSVHGDGLDADAVLHQRALTSGVPADHIDAYLALLAGHYLERRDQPVPNSSPYLRAHQSWLAEAAWSWLAARRGWSHPR